MNGIQEVGGSIPLGSTKYRQATRPDIAIYIKDLEGGGVQRQRLNLAKAFASRGRRVDIVVGCASGSLASEVPDGVGLWELAPVSRWRARWSVINASFGAWPATMAGVALNRKPARAFCYLSALADYLRRVSPRSLLCGAPTQNLMVCLARRAARVECPLVLSEHNDFSGGHELDDGSKGQAIRAMSRILYGDAVALVAVSEGVADDMVRRLGIERSRIRVIHQPAIGADVADRALRPLSHPWFEAGQPPVLLSAGRFAERKDFPTLIRAFATVRQKRPCRLVILGDAGSADDGTARETAYRELAKELDCAEDFDLPGYDPNPFRYMSRAAVFVLPSRHEGMPNVLAEAMAVGCPVVSTDCPSGPREILDHGRFGALVPVGDVEAMAAAISGTLDATPDRERLRQRSKILAADRSAALYEELLLPLASSGPTAGHRRAVNRP